MESLYMHSMRERQRERTHRKNSIQNNWLAIDIILQVSFFLQKIFEVSKVSKHLSFCTHQIGMCIDDDHHEGNIHLRDTKYLSGLHHGVICSFKNGWQCCFLNQNLSHTLVISPPSNFGSFVMTPLWLHQSKFSRVT